MATMFMGFWIAPVHGEAPLRDANQQAARADDAVRVGAEFFLNRTETADSVARHFRTMKDQGLLRGSSAERLPWAALVGDRISFCCGKSAAMPTLAWAC
jgi:hypothetical protein